MGRGVWWGGGGWGGAAQLGQGQVRLLLQQPGWVAGGWAGKACEWAGKWGLEGFVS
jgi:hypothetical protein